MHSMMHAVVAWVASHPEAVMTWCLMVAMAVVAHLPPKVARMPVVGALVRFMDRYSALRHARDVGAAVKWPGEASDAMKAAMAELVADAAPKAGGQ